MLGSSQGIAKRDNKTFADLALKSFSLWSKHMRDPFFSSRDIAEEPHSNKQGVAITAGGHGKKKSKHVQRSRLSLPPGTTPLQSERKTFLGQKVKNVKKQRHHARHIREICFILLIEYTKRSYSAMPSLRSWDMCTCIWVWWYLNI